MPTYILIKAKDGWNPDDPMVYQTGYPIDAKGRNRIGGMQVPPDYVQVEITDEEDFGLIQGIYCAEWKRDIDWEFIGHDYTVDGHRLSIFTKPGEVSVSGLNALTRENVETFLGKWNAAVISTSINSVVFDCIVFDAIKSESFWGYDTSLVGFTEVSYDQATELHEVEANYGNTGLTPGKVEKLVNLRGGVIVRHPTNKVIFKISRSVVFSLFKADVKEKAFKYFARRKFKLLQQHVDMALSNNGTLSVTKQQFSLYIANRLND